MGGERAVTSCRDADSVLTDLAVPGESNTAPIRMKGVKEGGKERGGEKNAILTSPPCREHVAMRRQPEPVALAHRHHAAGGPASCCA